MILDELWHSIAPKDGVMCLPCMENKLGRRIQASDLREKGTLNKMVGYLLRGLVILEVKDLGPGLRIGILDTPMYPCRYYAGYLTQDNCPRYNGSGWFANARARYLEVFVQGKNNKSQSE